MYSGSLPDNGSAHFTRCLCGTYFRPAQTQSSTYCDNCLRTIASHRQRQVTAPAGLQAPNYSSNSLEWEQPQYEQASGMAAGAEYAAPSQSQWPTYPVSRPTSVVATPLPLSPDVHARISTLRHSASSSHEPNLTSRRDLAAATSASITLPRLYVPTQINQSFGRSDGVLGDQDLVSALRPVGSVATIEASQGRRKQDAPFECTVPGCGSTFTREYNLNHHLNSHYGVKPYSCRWPGCSKTFGRPHDRARHEKGCVFFHE